MTYEEKYRNCATEKELIEAARKDAKVALFLNPDRLHAIQRAMNIVAKEKGWTQEGVSE